MSAKISGLVWEIDMEPHLKFVLLACAEQPGATPAMLGRLTGLAPWKVQHAIRFLCSLGVLHEVQVDGALVIDEAALEALGGKRV